MSTPWVEYQLNRLTFQNGEKIAFPPATRLRYGDQHHAVWIELEPAARRRIVGELAAHNDPALKLQELRRTDYAMLVWPEGRRGRMLRFGFFHMLKAGSGVALGVFDDGDLYFESGRPMFTKNYTLDDVTRGQVPSDFAVWQFHGYRHEH